MLSGLKKMVGKSTSPNCMDVSGNNLLAIESNHSSSASSSKAGKKRKVADTSESSFKRQYVLYYCTAKMYSAWFFCESLI